MVSKNDSAVEITDQEFNEIINNSHKLVVVDFFAEWCFPCIMLSPILEDLAEQMKEVKFAKINIDDNQKLAEKFEIKSIPCLIVFRNGKEVGRIIGSQTIEELEEKIKRLIK